MAKQRTRRETTDEPESEETQWVHPDVAKAMGGAQIDMGRKIKDEAEDE